MEKASYEIKVEQYNRAKKESNFRTEEFNNIQDKVRSETISFYEKLGLYSAGILSLSISSILAIKLPSNNILANYNWLFLIGVISLSTSFVFGLFLKLLNANKLFWVSKNRVAESWIRMAEKQNEIKGEDFLKEFISTTNKKLKGETNKEAILSILNTILSWLCIGLFVLGVISISTYFAVRIFDF